VLRHHLGLGDHLLGDHRMNPLIIFKLKCPVCGHTERKPAMEIPTDGPVCPKCYGPMIPEKVETRP
jgi:hypothetical protein